MISFLIPLKVLRMAEKEMEEMIARTGHVPTSHSPPPRAYEVWKLLMVIWALFSSLYAAFVFGFYYEQPVQSSVLLFDCVTLFIGLMDFFIELYVFAKGIIHRDVAQWVHSICDCIGYVPWILLTQRMSGFILFRIMRARKVFLYFQKKLMDLDCHYQRRSIMRILEAGLIFFFCIHVEGCLFYYLVNTILPTSQANSTWIGKVRFVGHDYAHFRSQPLVWQYISCIYFVTVIVLPLGAMGGLRYLVTMLMIGYENYENDVREIVFAMIITPFNLLAFACLLSKTNTLIRKLQSC